MPFIILQRLCITGVTGLPAHTESVYHQSGCLSGYMEARYHDRQILQEIPQIHQLLLKHSCLNRQHSLLSSDWGLASFTRSVTRSFTRSFTIDSFGPHQLGADITHSL